METHFRSKFQGERFCQWNGIQIKCRSSKSFTDALNILFQMISNSISNFDNLGMLWICKAVDFYFEVPSVGPNVFIAYSLVGPGLFSKEPWDLHELILKVLDFILSTSFHARISWFLLIPFFEFHERNITWWYLGVLHFRYMKLWWRYFYTVGM